MDSPVVYTVPEVAEILKCGKSVVYVLAAEGRLPSFKVGRAVRVTAEALEQFVKGQAS